MEWKEEYILRALVSEAWRNIATAQAEKGKSTLLKLCNFNRQYLKVFYEYVEVTSLVKTLVLSMKFWNSGKEYIL